MANVQGFLKRVHWEHVAGLALMLLWFMLALHGAKRKSPAMDEVPHIGAGLAELCLGDFRMNPEHPPLFKMLSVLPAVLLTHPPITNLREGRELLVWEQGNQWGWGYVALFFESPDPVRVLILSRLIPILTGGIGGLLAWLWAAEFGGRRAGFFAMAMLLLYPEYLGHARFVTLDVPTLVSCGAVSYAGWRWWKRPTRASMAAFILSASILALVKLPVIVFTVALWLVFWCLLALRRWSRGRVVSWPRQSVAVTPIKLAVMSMLLLLVAYFFQWAVVGFRFEVNNPRYPMAEKSLFVLPGEGRVSTLSTATRFLHANRLLPEASMALLNHVESIEGRAMYLLGQTARIGWYHYYAVTTLVKTPLLYLVGLLSVGVYTSRVFMWGRPLARERMLILLTPFVLILAFTVLARLNIGHRHILFVYFPWCVLLGVLLARLSWRQRWGRPVSLGAVLVSIAVLLSSHPNQETYFNLLGGGSAYAGWRIVRDSNVDWGTDLVLAGEVVRAIGAERVNLAYFGSGMPDAYGIKDFKFILPSYPFAIGMPDGVEPDPNLPTLVSLNALTSVRVLYPGLYDDEPQAILNSMVMFAPLSERVKD